MLRNSLIREMSFKANFLLWMIVEVLWFCGQIVFFSIIFGQVDRIGDWTKWEVVLLVGTHQMIAQIFQGFFFGWIVPVLIIANIPARLLIKPLGQPGWLMLHLVIASTIIFWLSRVFWRFALRRYSSASS